MIVVPFKAWHASCIELQPQQEGMQAVLEDASWKAAEGLEGMSFTALEGDVILMCGGAAPIWRGRLALWALLSKHCTPRTFGIIHRSTRDFIKALEFKRLEAHIKPDFDEGHRWARALGMRLEHFGLEKFFPDGSPAALYALTRD